LGNKNKRGATARNALSCLLSGRNDGASGRD
jgi:hypothetical protein